MNELEITGNKSIRLEEDLSKGKKIIIQKYLVNGRNFKIYYPYI